MLIWKGSLPIVDGFHMAVGIFSILFTSMLNVFARLWSGPRCLLIIDVLFAFTGLYSGCSLRNVAILTCALWHHLLIASVAGRRWAFAFSTSVGDVLSPPVMASVPALCMVPICFVTFADPIAFGPGCALLIGVHHTSMAYMILGSATLVKRRLAYLGVIPHSGLANRLIWAAHFAPLPTAYSCCVFQLRFLSKITPKYFALSTGCTVLDGTVHDGETRQLT